MTVTTNKRLGGSLFGSKVLLITPTGHTVWLWKSTFTLPSRGTRRTGPKCAFTVTVVLSSAVASHYFNVLTEWGDSEGAAMSLLHTVYDTRCRSTDQSRVFGFFCLSRMGRFNTIVFYDLTIFRDRQNKAIQHRRRGF